MSRKMYRLWTGSMSKTVCKEEDEEDMKRLCLRTLVGF